MRERYNLNQMLKEIESESNNSQCQNTNVKGTQEDISKLFSKKKLGNSTLGTQIEPANNSNQADK